jgi:hypothetical protein
MGDHATPFSKTVRFAGRCSCGAAMEATVDGTAFCQVCDNVPTDPGVNAK